MYMCYICAVMKKEKLTESHFIKAFILKVSDVIMNIIMKYSGDICALNTE